MDEQLDKTTFNKFVTLIYAKAGIKLGENKEALVSARITKRMRQLQLSNFRKYYELVEKDAGGTELVELLNVISTNVTHFFREERHFDLLAQIAGTWSTGTARRRIWCAASSTGEEPYTIAMVLRESMRDLSDVKILATDISTKVLDSAKNGIYEKKHLEKVPGHLLSKYFFKEKKEGLELYRVKDTLKHMLTFGRLNLAKPPFPLKGPLDIVFCRNVMIYFDNAVRKALLDEIYRLLKPGGYLFVGHAESLSGMLSEFKSVEPSVYIK